MNIEKEQFSLQSRPIVDKEIYTAYSFIVAGNCMVPLLPNRLQMSVEDTIITANPQEGDVGVLHFLKNGKWFVRFGIWGPIEKETDRRLILSLNRGEKHGPIWGMTEDYIFDKMYVIGVLNPYVYKQLLHKLQRGI